MPNKIQTEFSDTINTGIDIKDRKEICKSLSKLLANSYLLYLKTQNYHWNVTGNLFQSLHVLFEEQYKDLAEAIDTIAERIRALGEFAPGSFSSFVKLTSIKEEVAIPSADEMIRNLIKGNEAVVAGAREIIKISEEHDDDVTADLMVTRMHRHEKNAWMLRSLITTNQGN